MKGLILIGYQGIGKTAIAGKDGCIDLESSNFYINDERYPEWYKIYCEIALNIANQGYTVCVSSHKEVREYLHKKLKELPKNIGNIVIFCPTIIQKDEWINRLQKRYDETHSDKDNRALINAIEKYKYNITELTHSEFPCYHPEKLDYDLHDYILQMRYDWCLTLDKEKNK